jgi:DNA-binding MarR family transcriptional regulator
MAQSRERAEEPKSGGPGAALWRAANLWRRRQRAALEGFGVTPSQFLLLQGLAGHAARHAVTQAALAQHCGADVMMTSQLVRELERMGLVRREAHPSDSRAMALGLTDRGRRRLDRASPALAAAEQAYFGALGADVEAFTGALRLLGGEKPRRRVGAGAR